MILLTGATGTVGRALLAELTVAGEPVRCLVRDPRRLGPDRVRVQIALGDLADPPSFRNALRGVRAVVHLAATVRDTDAGSIEELNGIATWRLVQAAERAGVEHFVFISALGASAHHRARFQRAKALAERAVLASGLRHTVLAPSLTYAPGDRRTRVLTALALAPAVPLPGPGRARFQPIWAGDVASAVAAALRPDGAPVSLRIELAGPQELGRDDVVRALLEGAGRPRRVVHVPAAAAGFLLRSGEVLAKSRTLATWDEAELLEASMVSRDGTAGAASLGVHPRAMAEVLHLRGEAIRRDLIA